MSRFSTVLMNHARDRLLEVLGEAITYQLGPVDPLLSVAEGHLICSIVERNIAQSVDRPINIVVHCEPEGSPGRAED